MLARSAGGPATIIELSFSRGACLRYAAAVPDSAFLVRPVHSLHSSVLAVCLSGIQNLFQFARLQQCQGGFVVKEWILSQKERDLHPFIVRGQYAENYLKSRYYWARFRELPYRVAVA